MPKATVEEDDQSTTAPDNVTAERMVRQEPPVDSVAIPQRMQSAANFEFYSLTAVFCDRI